MSTPIRVIPCLDLDGGRVVKGVKFENIRDAGDPVELARRYVDEGADELTFLDISATLKRRATTVETLGALAAEIAIPITVGGGVREAADAARILGAGAAKVSINTAALARPDILSEIAAEHGSGALVLSIDARRDGEGLASGFEVTTHGGTRGAGIDAVTWAEQAQRAGVGEILLNSIDADGTTDGFDLEMLRAVRAATTCSLVASGGAGKAEHFTQAAQAGADAVLAASVFHFHTVTVCEVKAGLARAGFAVA